MVNVHTVAGWFESTMTNDDDVNEKLLDALVYAPLGLALEAKDLLPKLAERGRGQVALTRLAGTIAARQGQSEAAKLVDELRTGVEAFFTTTMTSNRIVQLLTPFARQAQQRGEDCCSRESGWRGSGLSPPSQRSEEPDWARKGCCRSLPKAGSPSSA